MKDSTAKKLKGFPAGHLVIGIDPLAKRNIISSFSEECTPEAKHAIPTCATVIVQDLNGGQNI